MTEEQAHDCSLYGHIWVRTGTAIDNSVMQWGLLYCMRCNQPAPESVSVAPPAETCPTCHGPLINPADWLGEEE